MLAVNHSAAFFGLVIAGAFAVATGACGDGAGGSGGQGAGNCTDDPCKLTPPQCGCGDEQRCTVDGQGARYCAQNGTAHPGEACAQGDGDCAAGATCVGLSANVHVCVAFCSTDADCANGGLCIRHLSDGNGGTLPAINLCTEGCDPAALTGCAAAGTACALLREAEGAGRWYAQCVIPATTSHEGDPCDAAPCGPGFACVAIDAVKTCHQLCVVGATGCVAPAQCAAFQMPVTIGSVEYGACE